MSLKPGIYALASLTGASLSPDDLHIMGLSAGTCDLVSTNSFAARPVDHDAAAHSIDVEQSGDVTSLLLGHLDEIDDLRTLLGLQRSVKPAGVAAAAIDRFGDAATLKMFGEWTFMQWHAQRGQLRVVTSENLRDPVYYAVLGDKLAVAPQQSLLTRLPWVGSELEPRNLLLLCARTSVRMLRTSETPWKHIHRVPPCSAAVFQREACNVNQQTGTEEYATWDHSFDDAVDALNCVGRRILAQHLQRDTSTAFLLSGGLDSTLLTALGTQERTPGHEMFCLCSSSDAGSPVEDETEHSAAVARHLNVPISSVRLPKYAGVLRPCPADIHWIESPLLQGNLHLYNALYQSARHHGAHTVVDGSWGEAATNNKRALPSSVNWSQRTFRMLRYASVAWYQERDWQRHAFHVRFSQGALEMAPIAWKERRGAAPAASAGSRGDHADLLKARRIATSTMHGVRAVYPYRDRRLARLVARMPWSFDHQFGMTRALGRTMLHGRIPEAIRLRQRGLPFSPELGRRLQSEAQMLRCLAAEYRDRGLGTWLDLPWLERKLHQMAAGTLLDPSTQVQVRATIHFAEFMAWAEGKLDLP